MGRVFAYARVSTDAQDLDPQTDELRKDGFDVLVIEKASGVSRTRPELAQLVREMKAGDVLKVVRIDRLARSVSHLLEVIETLEGKGAHFRSLRDPLDTITSLNLRDQADSGWSRKKGKRYLLTYSGVKIMWRRLRARVGVTDFRFHDLRHDLATKLLRQCSSNTPAPARTTTPSRMISIIEGASTSMGRGPSQASVGLAVLLRIAWRRQPNSCDGEIPVRRAIAETFAPCISVSAIIWGLSASDHSR